MQHTYTSSEHFQLGRRRNHARPGQRKFSYPRRELNSRPSEYYMFIGRSNHWTGGSRVRFLPGAWKFPLSRASMVSPPSKLKMFTGNVSVLLTSVSLKLSFRSPAEKKNKQEQNKQTLPRPTARIELTTLRFSGWNVRFSCSIRRIVSSILASGMKIFFVTGEHGFSPFQVENVHWKCICAAH